MCDWTGHRNRSSTDGEGKKYAEPESNNARLCSADRIRRELRFLNPSSARKGRSHDSWASATIQRDATYSRGWQAIGSNTAGDLRDGIPGGASG
jgi:hypothetical protein